MFKRFKAAKAFLAGDKIARHITGFFTPSLIVVLQPDKSVDPKLMGDNFVMGYIYGGIAVCLEALRVRDTMEKAFAIQQVFERLFPNNGRECTELCTLKADSEEPEFLEATRVGYEELLEVFNPSSNKMPHSLLDYVSNKY